MIDINFIRNNQEIVKASEKKRGHDLKLVDKVLKQDEEWKKELQVMQKLNQQRNIVSQEINKAKKAKDEKLAKKKIAEMRKVIDKTREQEDKAARLLKERNVTMKLIGNVLHKTVPKGKDDTENVETKKVGKVPKFNFPIKDHIELGMDLNLLELDTAAKV